MYDLHELVTFSYLGLPSMKLIPSALSHGVPRSSSQITYVELCLRTQGFVCCGNYYHWVDSRIDFAPQGDGGLTVA